MTILSSEQLRHVEFMDDDDETNETEPQQLDVKPRATKVLTVDIEDLKVWLGLGIINKTTYIYFMLRLKFDGSTNVDIQTLADSLNCDVSNAEGKMKNVSFTGEEVLSELAKLNKKGALSIRQTAIQLSLF